MNTERYASRKWLIAVFLLVTPTVLRVFGMLDQAGLLTVWGSVTALYFAANVGQKALTKEEK
jgi:hypothetical protein